MFEIKYERTLLKQSFKDGVKIFKDEVVGKTTNESFLTETVEMAKDLINQWNRQGKDVWKYVLTGANPHEPKENDFIHTTGNSYRIKG